MRSSAGTSFTALVVDRTGTRIACPVLRARSFTIESLTVGTDP